MTSISETDELEYINKILATIAKGQKIDYINTDNIENETLKNIYDNINFIYQKIEELNVYSSALSQGDLDVEFPPRNNYLVGGLKELHSNLLHLTWKVNQISSGDYNQKVDFMGHFSEAFNDMVFKLKTKEMQLSESINVVELLFKHSNIMIFIIDVKTKELIYCKEKNYDIYYDSEFSETSKNIVNKLNLKSISVSERNFDWDLFSEIDNKWYTVKSMIMAWTNHEEVYFHMLFDISEQKVIQEQLEIAILKDPKTGIYNTSYAIELISVLFKKDEPFCVCFFDLDGLKSVNDTYGHIVGDRLIKIFTEIVLGEIRTDDSFCRIGGDEFLLITPNSNERMAMKIINRIQKAIDLVNEAKMEKFVISFSYGIELSTNSDDHTPKRIIDDADKKMYEQKRTKKTLRKTYQ